MSRLAGNKVVVIGAGLGGLATAARLAHQGREVEVLEKGSGPGGRCGRLHVDGFTFDTGPTILLMPKVIEETFAAVGRKSSDYLELIQCHPNYRMHFRDGSDLTFATNLVQMRDELERIEPGSFSRYLSFLGLGREQYHASLERFVGRNFDGVHQFLSPGNVKAMLKVKALRNLYPVVARYFKDERIRAAMTFQTMYLGISPYESPAIYGMLPFTELAVGIWFPKGGMFAISRALERLCLELGVKIRYRTPVEKVTVEGGRTRGVRLPGGARVEADAVVCNADLPWAYKHLIDPADSAQPRLEKLRYTSSAFLMFLGMRKRYPGLLHHNVMFGGDYRGSFEDIFKRYRVPDDPSFYVNAPAHTDPSLAPPGKDSLYVLVPVPHRHPSIDWKVEGPKVREKVLDRLVELGHRDVRENIEVERTFSPDQFEAVLNLERGSAFGLAQNFMQVGPLRPANQDPNIDGLFFVGASTQPGTGIPTVLISAQLVVERLNQRFEWSHVRPVVATSQEAA